MGGQDAEARLDFGRYSNTTRIAWTIGHVRRSATFGRMQMDQAALAIVDRKCARLAWLTKAGEHGEWLTEIPPLLRWAFSVPILNAYLRQVIAMHDADQRTLQAHGRDALPELIRLGKKLRGTTGRP